MKRNLLLALLLACVPALGQFYSVLYDPTTSIIASPTNLAVIKVGTVEANTNITAAALVVTNTATVGTLMIGTTNVLTELGGKQVALDTNNFVLTVQQDLTWEQQTVTRHNVGAGAFFDAAGFPTIPGRTNIVFTGPYQLPASGLGWGMNGALGIHTQISFINTGDRGRIWNDTVVREVELYVPATLPVTCELHVDFWRFEGETNRCNLVGTTGDIRSLLTANGTVQKVTIPIPVAVRMGDVTGGHLVYDGVNWGAGFHVVASYTDNMLYYAYSATLRDGTPWFATGVGSLDDNTIPISVYGDAPVFTMIGDSRIDGYPYSNSLSKGVKTGTNWWSPDADPAYLLSQLTGLSVRNEGRSGYDTGEMYARIADVLASKATWYVFCTGLFNDIYASPNREEPDFLLSCTNIIDAILADGGKVIVVPDWPFKDFTYVPTYDTDIQNYTSDVWMGSLEAIVLSQYSASDVLWADTRNYMGQERPDTGSLYWREFNRWDLIPLFAYGAAMVSPPGALDLVHWSEAGEEAVARAIVSEVRAPLRILYDGADHLTEASASLLYQGTNAILTTLASGEAGGLTVAATAGATNATQLVTLAQLQAASPGGQSSFFNLAQNATGFGGFTSGTTNLNSLTAVSTVTTNAGVALVAGQYVAFFISTNTYASISDGLAVVSMWCFETSSGSPTIKAEVYLINSVTKQLEYEYEPSPAYQLVTGTLSGLVFSVPVTARSTGTNMHVAFGIKQGASGTVRLVTGGTYNSHANFPLPNSAFVLSAGAIGGTIDVLVAPAAAPTTNRLVFLGGILVSNIANYYP